MQKIKTKLRERIEFVLLQFLRVIIVIPLVWKVLVLDWFNIINLGFTLVLTFIPEWLEKWWKIRFSAGVKIFFWIFIILSNVLGDALKFYALEINGYYPWDAILHFSSGFFFTLVGFIVFSWLNNHTKKESIQTSKVFVCFFAFCFSIMCSAIWEFLEYWVDVVFDVGMGGDLFDTMSDMMLAALSSLITAIWSYFKLKKKRNNWFFKFMFKPQSETLNVETF